jgi:hypothetical protein
MWSFSRPDPRFRKPEPVRGFLDEYNWHEEAERRLRLEAHTPIKRPSPWPPTLEPNNKGTVQAHGRDSPTR